MRFTTHLALALALWGVAPGGTACRPAPKAGAPCQPEDGVACAATDQALFCEDGAWIEVPCRGPAGCSRRGGTNECDDTVSKEGDRCLRSPPVDYACSPDSARALMCTGGRFELWRQCRGEKACAVAPDRHLECDTTLGKVGDPCGREGTYACSVDRHAMLLCDGHTLAVTSTCRGPDGCRFDRESHKVECDDRVASEGDTCDAPNRITCALDHKVELVCDPGGEHKYVKKRECRRTDCRIDDNELFCD